MRRRWDAAAFVAECHNVRTADRALFAGIRDAGTKLVFTVRVPIRSSAATGQKHPFTTTPARDAATGSPCSAGTS
ncbi:MAG TPA: hypothetical protein VF003_11310 [Pseudonocardiaceae bacterium]